MLITLQNEVWQVGILPETGASIAFGRVKQGKAWVDVLRPTPEADYGNSSKTSSFIMLPWCNRIREGKLRFQAEEYQLQTTPDDGTARHGDVRNRQWQIDHQDATTVRLSIDSRRFADMNFPFAFSASIEYRLQANDFVWEISMKNEDERVIPAGFGFHPYFVRPPEAPQLTIPCNRAFHLVNHMAVAAPVPVPPSLDFRQPRSLDDHEFNDLLTNNAPDIPSVIDYRDICLKMYSDPVFCHILIYTPQGKPFFAVEPMSNANDGFNLHERGINEAGVIVLQPGETASGKVCLNVSNH